MEWYIECGGMYDINSQRIFGRKVFIKPSELNTTVKKRFDNIDVYSTNFLYNEEDQNASDLIGPLYIDLDGDIHDEESYDKVKQDTLTAISYLSTNLKVPREYIRIYFSGNKGFHVIVPHTVFGIAPCKNLNDKYKMIALDIKNYSLNKTIDTRIYDKKRLIRLPHSINGKTGLYKVPLSEEVLRASTYASMKLYASKDRTIKYIETKTVEDARRAFDETTKIKPKIKKPLNTSYINPNYEIPLCIKYIYAKGSAQGARNNTLVILASSLLQKGMELEECIDTLVEWDEEKNEPSMGANEVETTVRSAYRNLADGRRYGCASVSEIGMCVGNQCKLYK